MTARLAALAGVVLLVAAPVPPASATVPPVVDGAALPAPGPPSPPGPTEQVDACRSGGTAEPGRPQLPPAERHALWQLSRGAGQTVAVIDTGVARHRLLPRLRPGGDFVSTGDGTSDCDGHGTVVAGIIGAAPDGEAFAGIAPDADILAIRQSSTMFRQVGDTGTGVGDVLTLARAVRAAADAGATVINVSTAACAPAGDGLADGALGAALAYAVDVKNAVVVAAAGNTGGVDGCDGRNPVTGPPDWAGVEVVVSPAWYDDYVLTVGSVDRNGRPSDFTLAGPWVDVAAVGREVLSLAPDGDALTGVTPGGSAPLSGTSYAAPVVSAVAALIRSRAPHLTARQVMQRLEDTAVRPPAGWDPRVGHGVVDPLAAVSGAAPSPPPAAAVAVLVPTAPGAPATRSRTVAFGGVAACLAVAAAAARWSRRRGRASDGGPVDAEFGSAR